MGFRAFKRRVKLHQYFENNPNLQHEFRDIQVECRNQKLTFRADRGVFSNTKIDEGSLALLDEVCKLNLSGKVLDVGCGYGTLGIVIARLFPDTIVTMFDVNERAIELCTHNIKQNNTPNATCFVSSNYQALTEKTFDLIVINPPIRAGKKVYHELLARAKNYLTDGGTLTYVMRKDHGAKSSAEFMKEVYGNVTLLAKNKGFYVYSVVNAII